MSDSEINFEIENEIEDLQELSENETPYVVQEICENTEIEITTLSHANNDSNSNNDYNDSIINKFNEAYSVKKDSNFISNDKNLDLCLSCNLKIYPMDKLTMDGKLYHKNCFRCSKCRTILSVTNFNYSNNMIYCKTHFMELFKMRGKYDDCGIIANEVVLQNEEYTEPIPSTNTKSLLEKFRQLESGSTSNYNSSTKTLNTTMRHSNHTDDIVRSQDIPQDELPPPETAKTMVAKFQALESKKHIPVPELVQQIQMPSKINFNHNANVQLQIDAEITNQCTNDFQKNEELPEEGTTRNLLNLFQNLSDNAEI